LGPEKYQHLNPCKLTNLLHLVAIIWGRNFKRLAVNIFGGRQIEFGNPPDFLQQQIVEHCNSSFIYLTDFTTSYKRTQLLQRLSSVFVMSAELCDLLNC
jgi:hypothetical protein